MNILGYLLMTALGSVLIMLGTYVIVKRKAWTLPGGAVASTISLGFSMKQEGLVIALGVVVALAAHFLAVVIQRNILDRKRSTI